MQSPKIAGAPGLGWRPRASGPVAYWVADKAVIAQGYPVKTVRLWPPSNAPHPGAPTTADEKYIADQCIRLQGEMLQWKQGGTVHEDGRPTVKFNGTVTSLSRCYQIDPDSEYAGVRYKSRIYYDKLLAAIERTVGARSLAALNARDFKRWFEAWSVDPDGSKHIPRAAALMTKFRDLIRYGVTMLEDEHCRRIQSVLCGEHGLKFKKGRRRKMVITAEQATAVRHGAHRMGLPEVAFAQALQFELLLRQKDVIGELIPLNEPGVSDIIINGMKWVVGLHWREVSSDLILTHTLSKSLRGRHALANPGDEAEEKVWDLKRYPMIIEEITHIPVEQRVGPMIKRRNGLPFRCDETYRQAWRRVADSVGVPLNVQNRDSRAGGITETIRATGGNMDAARIAAGHADEDTTRIYDREETERMAEVADLRAARRKKNGT